MTIDAVQIRALRVVTAVAQQGSFAAAGRYLGLPRATISRIVGQLEAQTGTRLFRRSTRKVVPTEAGEVLVQVSERALAEIDAALDLAESRSGALSGDICLSVSHAFGRRFVLPAVATFHERHPSVHVEARLEDKLDDMIEDAIDLTLRLGPVPQGDLIVRRVGAFAAGLFAAPVLLDTIDHPITVENLHRLPAIGFRIPGTGKILSWPVGADRSVRPEAAMTSSSIEATADLARLGRGVALLPHYLVEAEIAAGTLMPVLPAAVGLSTDVHICFKEKQFMPRRVRALIDHLATSIAAELRTAS